MSFWSRIIDTYREIIENQNAPNPVNPSAPDPVDPSEGVHVIDDYNLAIVDVRKIANPWRVDAKGRRWTINNGQRLWKQITGICLHQTACVLGERPARWATCGSHYGVMRSGNCVQIYDDETFVWASNGWSAGTIAIEIDGLFAGVEGRPETVWDDKSTAKREEANDLTDAQVTTTCALIERICMRAAANGGKIRALVSHRQSSEDRRDDPGSAAWRRIALPMSAKLQLTDGGPGFKLGTGRPNPEEWDPSRKGYKY